MSSVEILKHLEQNMNVMEKMQYLLKWERELSYEQLVEDIGFDSFRGYEYFLAVVMLTTYDPIIERARDRLFLQWFRNELESKGESETMDRIVQILGEECRSVEARRKRAMESEQPTMEG